MYRTTVAIAIASATFAADQLTKAGAADGATFTNPDLALGLATGTHVVLVALMAVVLVATAVLAVHAGARRRVPLWAVGLALGGAASNLADRAAFGAVRDVLVVADTVVVNLADAAIVVGVAVVATALWRSPNLMQERG